LVSNTKSRRAIINITEEVHQAIDESGVQAGLALINAVHITAVVFTTNDETGLRHDSEVTLEKLAPEKPYSQYQHNGFEDNADAPMKRQIMGGRAWSPSPAAGSTSALGSRSSPPRSTASGIRGSSSRSSGSDPLRRASPLGHTQRV